jgi:hypothetical protein
MSLKTKIGQQLLLSMISPVIGLIYAFKSRNHKFIVFSGTLFMGLVGSAFMYNPGSDGLSHLDEVKKHYMDMSLLQFISDTGSLLILQPVESSNDLYIHFLSYLAGGVFGIPELLHFFAGLILGYFYTKSVLIVLEDRFERKKTWLLLALIALFLIIRSVSALNSIRMWTGMWVFFYGSYSYIKRGDVKYLLVVFLATLIHFSYLLYAIPLVMAVVLKRRKLLVAGLYIASFFISVNFDTASGLVESTGLYENKTGYVLSQERIEEHEAKADDNRQNANFYKALGPLIYTNYSIVFLSFVLLFLYLRKNNDVVHLEFLIAGGLIILALANISSSSSPMVSGRATAIAATFLTAAAIQVVFLENKLRFNSGLKKLINISFAGFLISAIPFLLFHISYAIGSVSIFIIVFPFSSWLLGDIDLSIREAIGDII